MARVLVVDDVKFISMMLAEILRKAGHEVEIASNGREAIDKAGTGSPDLVVMDVSMPELDGIEVTRALRADERTRDVPVLMVTARTDDKTRAAAVAAGANDYVVKPFEASALVRKATALLGKPSVGPSRVPTESSIYRVLLPGIQLEDNPKALVVRMKVDEVPANLIETLEPELARTKRGVLFSWQAPDAAPPAAIEIFRQLAARLATEGRVLRIANAPPEVARAFEQAGQPGLLLAPRKAPGA